MENKQFKYTDLELELIKNTFANNDDLLILIRRFLLQDKLDAVELASLRLAQGKDVIAILRKIILSELNLKAPVGQLGDMWMSLNLANQIKDQMLPHIESKKIVIEYLTQRLDALSEKEVKSSIDFESLLDGTFEGVNARNQIIEYIERAISFLKVIAGDKEETPEQQKKRLIQNSNK